MSKEKKQIKWRRDLNYSCRTKSDINIDALPLADGVHLGIVLYRPWDERFKLMETGKDSRKFFKEVLPMFEPYIKDEDMEKFAQKNYTSLPKFTYAAPNIFKGKTTALLGDSIHTVKPYFGLGVNTAFEDVAALDTALEEKGDNVEEAIELFSNRRAPEARTLVQISRKLDGGFLTFILPLIVDSILHKLLPQVFSPNTLASLQNENRTFTEIRNRKRMDRVMQVTTGLLVLRTIVYFVSRITTTLIKKFPRILKQLKFA